MLKTDEGVNYIIVKFFCHFVKTVHLMNSLEGLLLPFLVKNFLKIVGYSGSSSIFALLLKNITRLSTD